MSNEQEIRFFSVPLSITLQAPIVTHTDGLKRWDVDIASARDWPHILIDHNNAEHAAPFILPGTAIAGIVRARLEALGMEGVLPYFGKYAGDKQVEDNRRCVIFSDLKAPTDTSARRLTRNSIDDDLGVVKEGHLLTIEAIGDFGQDVKFEGTVTVIGTQSEAQKIRDGIELAFRSVQAIGTMKTAGFGHVVLDEDGQQKISLGEIGEGYVCFPSPKDSTTDVRENMLLSFEIDRPFLVNAQYSGSNYIYGDEIIPGGAIKGAMARWAIQSGAMGDDEFSSFFSAVRMGHAYPVVAQGNDIGKIPVRLPLNTDEDGNTYRPGLDGSVKTHNSAANLVPLCDAKNIAERLSKNGWATDLAHHTRTRTQIGQTGAAEDENLFVQRSIAPVFNQSTETVHWVARLHCPDFANNEKHLQRFVAALKQGVLGLGKTGATIKCVHSPFQSPPSTQKPNDRKYTVVLQSPMVMHDIQSIRDVQNGERDLRQTYVDYWSKILGFMDVAQALDDNTFQFMAEQELAGGFVARKFPQSGAPGYPYLVTKPGSVFIFRVDDAVQEKFLELLELLKRKGLPSLGASSIDDVGNHKTNPFIRENGYGEIYVV